MIVCEVLEILAIQLLDVEDSSYENNDHQRQFWGSLFLSYSNFTVKNFFGNIFCHFQI